MWCIKFVFINKQTHGILVKVLIVDILCEMCNLNISDTLEMFFGISMSFLPHNRKVIDMLAKIPRRQINWGGLRHEH